QTDDVVSDLTLTVRAILPDKGLSRFSLKPDPSAPRNAFVPLALLQKELDLKGRINAILDGPARHEGVRNGQRAALRGYHNELRPQRLALDDWGLVLRTPEERARRLVHILEPNRPGGPVRRAKWTGRVPDELVKAADPKGQLSVEAVEA